MERGLRRPLTGMTAVEIPGGIAAGVCGRLLSDLGMAVHRPPLSLFIPENDGRLRLFEGGDGLAAFLHAGKHQHTADSLDGPAGLDRLLATAGLVIDSTVGGARLGGVPLAERASGIYLALTPFGGEGPLAHWNGAELNTFHFSTAGYEHLGRPDREPLQSGTHQAQMWAGLAATYNALAALLSMPRPRRIDLAEAEPLAMLFVAYGTLLSERAGLGPIPGYARGSSQANSFRARDGYLKVSFMEDAQFAGFTAAMGVPEWADLQVFNSFNARLENGDALKLLIEELIAGLDRDEVVARLEGRGVPAGPVQSFDEVLRDPQLTASRFFHALDVGGRTVLAPSVPWSLSARARPAPSTRRHPVPRAGRLMRGVRVLNLARVWSGAAAGHLLGDLGAAVVKVEARDTPDLIRRLTPRLGGRENASVYSLSLYRNQRLLLADLKNPPEREGILRLVDEADILIENFTSGALERLGLGPDVLFARNPALTLIRAPLGGQDGPYRGRRSYGATVAALCGIDWAQTYAGEDEPISYSRAFTDALVGLWVAVAAQASILAGPPAAGRLVELSQLECGAFTAAGALLDHQLGDAGPARHGNSPPGWFLNGLFPCAGEDLIALAVADEAMWKRLAVLLGLPADALGCADSDSRARSSRLGRLVQDALASEPAGPFCERAQRAGVFASPVHSARTLFDSPWWRERGNEIAVRAGSAGECATYGSLYKPSPPVSLTVAVNPDPDADVDLRALLATGEPSLWAALESLG